MGVHRFKQSSNGGFFPGQHLIGCLLSLFSPPNVHYTPCYSKTSISRIPTEGRNVAETVFSFFAGQQCIETLIIIPSTQNVIIM
jgi:hypothetical protein